MATKPDKREAVEALERTASQLASLVRDVGDSSDVAVGYWTVKHIAAHLAASAALFVGYAKGEGSAIEATSERSAFGESALQPFFSKSAAELASSYESSIERFIGVISSTDGDPERPWIARIPVPLSSLAAISLGEALVHGLDIAKATSRRWSVGSRESGIVVLGLLPSLPHFVRRDVAADLSACYEMRLRDAGRFFLVFERGRLSVEEPSGRAVDCHLSLDPASYLLIGYGRKAQWGPALTGKLIAWGRKPWLALKLSKLFENP